MTAKRLTLVDYLKGYSILTIVLFHLSLSMNLPGIIKMAANFGGAGVHVFVLCSGFGLYLSHLHKKMGYGDYMKRRLLRVHLPFLLVVLATVLVPWNKFDLHAFLSNIFFYKMFSEEWNCAYGGQMWFVSMIVQMYLLFPMLAKLFDRYEQSRGGNTLSLSVHSASVWHGRQPSHYSVNQI